jgi:hypothetical protein
MASYETGYTKLHQKLQRLPTKETNACENTIINDINISGAASGKVAMDIAGSLTPTKAEHNYILTIKDLFTKFLVVIPLE